MLDIRPAEPEDLGAIKVLLAVCLLPSQDVNDSAIDFFVAESERGIIGVCGIERCGKDHALLRSLGVMPGYRKQQIGRRLVQRAQSHAEVLGIGNLFLLTETAADYFRQGGFTPIDRSAAPSDLKSSRLFSKLCPSTAVLMKRAIGTEQAEPATSTEARVAEAAKRHFDDGYHCAESVLLAAAEHAGIRSSLIPGIATGFCHGTARTWGTCGALNGAIMAVSLTHGRSSPGQPTAKNYTAVKTLIDQFSNACGATLCSELMGCDLDTRDGQKTYQDNHLRNQCREFVGVATRLAVQLIGQRPKEEEKRVSA